MIDQIDERLKTWVTSVLGTTAPSVSVALTPPRDALADPVVHLYLLQLVPALASPDPRRAPLQVMLSYLVVVRAADPETGHKLLGELILAALDNNDFSLDFNPLPVETWIALGTEPQPGFILKVPLTRDRAIPDIPLIRAPMVTRVAPVTSLQGVVLGPQDLPLTGVMVELPALRLHQRTDSHGRFHFQTIPSEAPFKLSLHISGKGHDLEVSVDQPAEPLIIHLFEETSP